MAITHFLNLNLIAHISSVSFIVGYFVLRHKPLNLLFDFFLGCPGVAGPAGARTCNP